MKRLALGLLLLPAFAPAGDPPKLAALGAPPIPPDNRMSDAKVELGKMLYFEKRLSGDTTFSCASCHDPQKGWGDGHAISTGYPGTRHWRNAQTIINSAYYDKLFWGGEVTSLETQANSAIGGNLAQNGDPEMIEERLAQVPEYVRRFEEVFGTPPRYALVLKAIAAFERTLVQRDTPFDRYLNGDKTALSEEAVRGMALFEGKAGCIQCHHGAMLTDQSYHNTGAPENDFFEKSEQAQIALRFQHYARGVPEEVYRHADRDLGLYYTSKVDGDKGKFRTPSLRYLIYTGPYMHNGVFELLEEVIDFYNDGGGDDPNKSPLIEKLNLSDAEKEDLLAFLESLSGDEIVVEPPEPPPYAPMED